MPTVRIRLFATARTAAGRAEIEWPVPPAGVLARDLLRELGDSLPALAPVLRASRILRNGEVAEPGAARLVPGDELAVHPPYGGG